MQQIEAETKVRSSTLRGWFSESPGKQKLPRDKESLLAVVHALKRRVPKSSSLPPAIAMSDTGWVELQRRAKQGEAGSGKPGSGSARDWFAAEGMPLTFGGIDLGVQVLFGPLGSSWGSNDIQALPMTAPWAAPAELVEFVKPYADQRGIYNGNCARLNRLDVVPYSADGVTEHHRLRLEMAPTGYFDMLATNFALGPFTTEGAPLLAGRSGLARTRLSNLVQTELVLITSDGQVPVFRRADQMAMLQGCWQVSSGETLQLPADLAGTSGRPDLFKTALRGLDEETGLSSTLVTDLAITAFVATPEFATVGVLMRGNLNCTAMELARRHSHSILNARDSWEHTGRDLLPIDDVRELAKALTVRRWSKQSASALVYAHAERVGGHIEPLAQEIERNGGLMLDPGQRQDIIPRGLRDDLAKKYLFSGSAEESSTLA
ncbi:hypothetical protein ACFYTF_30960 [Nocardia thailandica]|uniref:Nudix hydrolase domain-containing protein n=1 Tax=Nocardia thailandica TaxID=257275 RepID=A0ABW6PXV3_9NOCA